MAVGGNNCNWTVKRTPIRKLKATRAGMVASESRLIGRWRGNLELDESTGR